MREIENHCVSCGLPCIGDACCYMNVPVYYCDWCGHEASYVIEGKDYCEECAEDCLQQMFDDYTVMEKGYLIQVDISHIEDKVE